MELSRRLRTVADMVTPGLTVADVGCDHGFVSIYLCQSRVAPKVYAMDLREGPLRRAKAHIREYGCGAYIETRLSDGLSALEPGEADALILSGMGGRLMQKILREGEAKVRRMCELILQPQSEIAALRAYLRESGFCIEREELVEEDGKFYPVIKAVPGQIAGAHDTQGESRKTKEELLLEDAFGPCLIAQSHPVLFRYLEVLDERNRNILTHLSSHGTDEAPRTKRRRRELEREREQIARCRRLMQDKQGVNAYEMYGDHGEA